MFLTLCLFLLSGAFAGIIAGLLGVGGGIIIVPMLVYTFPLLDVPQDLVHHLALGTSLASIMVTSVSSGRSHYKKGAVNVELFKKITPGILVGTFCGGFIASYMPILLLKLFFIVFIYFVATQMFFSVKAKPSRHLPGTLGTTSMGGFIGLISSFVGIGGGTLTVPFATFCNEPMHRAVGTSAAIGFPIAVAGTLSYLIAGWNVPNLPAGAVGYVHWLAFFGIACASYFTAPLGVKLSHALPVSTLKHFFAVFLFIMASRMVYDLYF